MLGQGSFGKVIKAKIRATRQFCAVKMMTPNKDFSEEDLQCEINIFKKIKQYHLHII